MDVTGCSGTANEVRFLEHVQCKVSLRFMPRGNLRVRLTSPAGTTSTLLTPRPRDLLSSAFDDWPFLSVHYWGEAPDGRWTLDIVNAGGRRVTQPGEGWLLNCSHLMVLPEVRVIDVLVQKERNSWR